MRINFRQGLVSSEIGDNGLPNFLTSNSTGITLRTSNRPVIFSVANGAKNYTIGFYSDVLAWPIELFSGLTEAWLYIDINTASSARRYGVTTVAPTYGTVVPANPVDGQMWYDTTKNLTKVYNATALTWFTSIRVVAGHFQTTSLVPVNFGTQIGTSGSSYISGSIMVDGFGVAIKDSSGFFVTTEDVLLVDGASTYAAKLESNVVVASADQPIAAFHVICYTNSGKVRPADYDDVGGNIVGIATIDAFTTEPVNLVLSGKVHNPMWNWGSANVTLWVGQNGELVAVDPFDVGGRAKRRVPVARSIDSQTIIFDQGLGGVGEKGDSGDVAGNPPAGQFIRGITKLSIEPIDATNPVAVGINDPILTAPRVPIPHSHPASEVSVSPFGTFNGTNAQQALEYLQSNKLGVSGGTVIGAITSTAPATEDGHLITLGQTKTLVSGMTLSYKRLVLSSAQQSAVVAFNLLTAEQRTIATNMVVVVEWKESVYLWTGGAGAPAVATQETQFMWVGKTAVSIQADW